MARRSTVKSVADTSVVDNTTDVVATNKSTIQENAQPLSDNDEIEVVCLSPNVSYKDSYTNDLYEWKNVGDIEFVPYRVLANMWRNHKGYFRNLLLKPLDDRVIQKFKLEKVYTEYEFLMDGTNYNRRNIDKICSSIASTSAGMKFSIYTKIKNLVSDGEISDIFVVRKLEEKFDLGLLTFL